MAKGYIFDKLMNRKIEGDSSFVSQESFDELYEDVASDEEDIGDIKQVLEAVENFNLETTTILPEGVTESDTAYKKCVYIPSSKILWIIIETRLTNSNESSAPVGNLNVSATVTDAIGAKVMKIDGISIKDYVSDSGQSNVITKASGVIGTGGSSAPFTVACYSKNKISVYCAIGNMGASSSQYVSVRVPLLIV